MKWFKFYGAEYLSDPKMLALTPCERSCWLSLLCYANVNDNGNDNGTVKHITEERLMIQAGLNPVDDEWEKTTGVLEKFKKLEMIQIDNETITIINWKKRQETNLTGYERIKRYREKKRNDNALITSDKNRREEKREDKNKKDISVADDNFVFEEELKKLKEGKRKDYKIIALYWLKKGWKFANKEQFNAALVRELRPAKSLIGYSGVEISNAIQFCQENYPQWSMETLHKRITDLINKK